MSYTTLKKVSEKTTIGEKKLYNAIKKMPINDKIPTIKGENTYLIKTQDEQKLIDFMFNKAETTSNKRRKTIKANKPHLKKETNLKKKTTTA